MSNNKNNAIDTSTTAGKIAVMQAFCSGKKIQYQILAGSDMWFDAAREPAWNWNEYNYRIKPEPKEIWIVSYKLKGLTIRTTPFLNHEAAAEYVRACIHGRDAEITKFIEATTE